MTRIPPRLVIALAVCVLSAALGTSAANVALPALAAGFGGVFAAAQWVVLAYLLAMTAMSLAVGFWGDVLGRMRTLRIGVVVFVVATLLCAAAPSLGVLVAARALQGAGAAAMATLPLAVARDRVADDRVGSVMGLLGTTMAAGTALGPALGGVLVGHWGWPAVFWAMVPLACLAMPLLPREERPGSRASGSSGRRRRPPRVAGARRLASAVGLATGLNLLVAAVMISTLVVGPFTLSVMLGLDAGAVGIAMAAGPLTSVCTGALAGRATDRFGAPRIVVAGLALMTAGALALTLLPQVWGLAGYLVGTVSLAPGYQLFMAANNTQVMGRVDPDQRGAASGALGLSRNLGLILGTSAAGSLFAAVSAASGVAAVTALVFGIAAAALLAGMALAHRADRHRRSAQADAPDLP